MSVPSTRPAVPADRELVRRLRLRTLRESPEAFRTQAEDVLAQEAQDPQYWDRFLADGACLLVTPEGAPEPLGLARIVPPATTGEPASIHSVWVAPETRGSGAGRALVDACIDWAEEHLPGVRLRLHVMEQNAAARRLYEHCGFGEVAPDPERPGQIRMERRSGRARPAQHVRPALAQEE